MTKDPRIAKALTILNRNPRIYPADAESVLYHVKQGDGERAYNEALEAAARPRSQEQYDADMASSWRLHWRASLGAASPQEKESSHMPYIHHLHTLTVDQTLALYVSRPWRIVESIDGDGWTIQRDNAVDVCRPTAAEAIAYVRRVQAADADTQGHGNVVTVTWEPKTKIGCLVVAAVTS